MIKQETFREKFKDAKLLLNATIKGEAGDAIYDRVKDRFTQSDFILAIDAVVELGDKLNYFTLKRQLDKFKAVRLDAERQAEKMKIREQELNMPRKAPEVMKMLNAIMCHDIETIKKYGMDKPFLKGNAILIGKDGYHRDILIDFDPEGDNERIATRTYEQVGENVVLKAFITPGCYRELVDRPEETEKDLDFIPEIEEEYWNH
jgi:hypothetical protein